MIALDRSHLAEARVPGRACARTLKLLMDYAPGTFIRDVPDPYYTSGFDQCTRWSSWPAAACWMDPSAHERLQPDPAGDPTRTAGGGQLSGACEGRRGHHGGRVRMNPAAQAGKPAALPHQPVSSSWPSYLL
ncbi:MAG: hypothetical protein U0Z44_00310 [Kouleothrix sp.]